MGAAWVAMYIICTVPLPLQDLNYNLMNTLKIVLLLYQNQHSFKSAVFNDDDMTLITLEKYSP